MKNNYSEHDRVIVKIQLNMLFMQFNFSLSSFIYNNWTVNDVKLLLL